MQHYLGHYIHGTNVGMIPSTRHNMNVTREREGKEITNLMTLIDQLVVEILSINPDSPEAICIGMPNIFHVEITENILSSLEHQHCKLDPFQRLKTHATALHNFSIFLAWPKKRTAKIKIRLHVLCSLILIYAVRKNTYL